MQITYNVTEEDQKKYIATNFVQKKTSFRKIIIILSIIVLIFSSLTLFAVSEYFLGSVAFFFAALYFYFCFLYPKRLKKKYLQKLNSTGILEETKTVEVSDDELRFISSSRKTSHKYSDIFKISILKDNFILINFKHEDSLAIPKSAFSDNAEMTNFINKIKSNAKIL